ncbi:magnesium chelatase subunit H [uncultured Salinisphaera sp.]|uniref:magnesium chelatase subunit H n=1 Tax=uncultured Salinisphaera sp. TaxID=359372 RepID=UPI0032B1E515
MHPSNDSPDIRVAIVTMDRHLAGATERAEQALKQDLPNLKLTLHAASDWEHNAEALATCRDDIARADIIVASMLFMEDHVNPVLDALQARRDHCDALVACMSAGEVVRLTRIGRLDMSAKQGGPMALLKRLKGERKKTQTSSGAKQMAMLRRLPRILRYIPGTAQDLRVYFLTLQYWLASSDENLAGMVRLLVNRYADGEREGVRGALKARPPVDYPDDGLYHPRLAERITVDRAALPAPANANATERRGVVGLLVMRSYVLANDTGHYDAVIAALEARGYQVVPAFASGLDATATIESFFLDADGATIDALVSLTGFSLVGGPAYNDSAAAQELLARLDVPYIAAHALEFQSLEQWQASDRGLMPVEATINVAIPEIDGATGSIVFGGRIDGEREMSGHPERIERLAARVDRQINLRRTPRASRRLAITVFGFPPNAGNVGTAAFLSVWASIYQTLKALVDDGYDVELPESVDALREAIVGGNAEAHGTTANVHASIPVDDHVAREPYLDAIEAAWGAAPGKHNSDGRRIHILGARFGNVFIGVQPAFGYEGDPMRLLFEHGFAPTHAFSAYYRWLREDFAADAVLHFGTHGALEFMPGKQAGLTGECWPDRLIGDLPNIYLYAANNPSEGTLAKRRSAATLVSYMTPPLAQAGLYREWLDLKESLSRWRQCGPDHVAEAERLAEVIQAQAAGLDLCEPEPAWPDANDEIARLSRQVVEVEGALIPEGLHVLGAPADSKRQHELLRAVADANYDLALDDDALSAFLADPTAHRIEGLDDEQHDKLRALAVALADNTEIKSLLAALDGRFVRPVAGGDILRNPAVLPTGRNLHGFDPFRLPSAFAISEGRRHAELLLERHRADGHDYPASIALVLWGTDNLKTEGAPIGQALALMGAKPRHDSFGRVAGAELIPLSELGRPRVDVVLTLSGIFRDLLPLATRMLAEAAWLAATAEDESATDNPIRAHALAYQAEHDCDLETAALRVFSNADGAYGANVNLLLDSSAWGDENELAETYSQRKCFAYGRKGEPVKQPELLAAALSHVELTYQNLESVELGVTTISHYMDTLGGISRSVARARGGQQPTCYIGDQTKSRATVRTLREQITLETRTRMLNPKWQEGLLSHGYEGVRQIEEHITNTMGWSATNEAVAPWVYQRISETYLLDETMRNRLAELNPTASARMANRLLEAQERNYWAPDDDMLDALRAAGDDLEDRLEGIHPEAATA